MPAGRAPLNEPRPHGSRRSGARRCCAPSAPARRTSSDLARELRRVGDDRPPRPARARPRRASSSACAAARCTPARRAAVRGDRVERFAAKDRIGAAAAALVADGADGDDRHRHHDAAGGAPPARPAAHRGHVEPRRATRSCCPTTAIELVLPGGVVRRNYRSLVGVLAEDSLRQLRADVLFLGHERGRRAARGVGLHDGRGADQARDDRGGRARSCCSPTPGSSRCAGVVRVCERGRDRPHRHRRRAPGRGARRDRRGGDRGHARMKLTIVGGGGFRVPLVYGALLEQGRAAAARRGRAARRRRAPARADRARCSTGSPRSTAGGSRSARPRTSTTPSRAPTTCSARSAPASSRAASSTRASRSASACSARRRPGPGGICFALRTIPPMVALAETIAARAPGAWLINFTNPAGMVTEAVQQVLGERAVGVCDSPSGLCRRVAARGRARAAATSRSTTSASTTSAGSRASRDRDGELLPGLLGRRRRARGLRGGPPVRRRLAALARDDPERVPLLLLLRERHGRRDPRSAASRAARSCSSSSARSTPQDGQPPPRRSPPGARRATTASARTWPRRAARPATPASTRSRRTPATRPRRWPCSRRWRSTRAPS